MKLILSSRVLAIPMLILSMTGALKMPAVHAVIELKLAGTNAFAKAPYFSWETETNAGSLYEIWKASTPEIADAAKIATLRTNTFYDWRAKLHETNTYWLKVVTDGITSDPGEPLTLVQNVNVASVALAGTAISEPVVDNEGNIYFSRRDSSRTTLVALDRYFKVVWEKTILNPWLAGPTVGPSGVIYCLDNGVSAYDSSGHRLWRTEITNFVPNRFPVAVSVEGAIYALGQRTKIALEKEGNLRWSVNCGSADSFPVIRRDGREVILSGGFRVYRPDGILELYNSNGQVGIPLAAFPDNSIMTDFFGSQKIDETGKTVFTFRQTQISFPAISESGEIYLADRYFKALNASGNQIWGLTNDFSVNGAVVHTDKGYLYAGTSESFLQHSKYPVLGSVRTNGGESAFIPLPTMIRHGPILTDDGRLIFITTDHFLRVVQAVGGPAEGWPMYRQNARGSLSAEIGIHALQSPRNIGIEQKDTSISITWVASGEWATNEIWRSQSLDLSKAERIGETAPGIQVFVDTTPMVGKTYYYFVRSVRVGEAGPTAMSLAAELAKPVEVVGSSTNLNIWLNFEGSTISPDGSLLVNGLFDSYQISPKAQLISSNFTSDVLIGPPVVSTSGDTILLKLNGWQTGYGQSGRTGIFNYPFQSFNMALGTSYLIAIENARDLTSFGLDGNRRWSHPVGYVVVGPVISAQGTIIVGTSEGTILSYSETGEFLWSTDLESSIRKIVLDTDGNSYVASGSKIISIDPGGSVRWTNVSDGICNSLCIDSSNQVHTLKVKNGNGLDRVAFLAKLSANGQLLEKTELPINNAFKLLLASNGIRYLLRTTGVSAFQNGKIIWSYSNPFAVQGINLGYDGRIYLWGGEGVTVLQTDTVPAGAWPMEYANSRSSSSLQRPPAPSLSLRSENSKLLFKDLNLRGYTLLESSNMVNWAISDPQVVTPDKPNAFFKVVMP